MSVLTNMLTSSGSENLPYIQPLGQGFSERLLDRDRKGSTLRVRYWDPVLFRHALITI